MTTRTWMLSAVLALIAGGPGAASLAAQAEACTDSVRPRGAACDAVAPEPPPIRWKQFAEDVLGPRVLIGNLAAATIDHLADEPEEWNGRWGGWGRRVASQAGQVAVGESVEHGLAAILDRPTRYRPCTPCRSTGQRIGYAFHATVFDRTSDGGTALAVPRIAGSYAGAFARLAWTPGWGAEDALLYGTMSVLFSAIPNLAQEIFGLGGDDEKSETGK